jgi:type IV pilus assembly protein PilO
MILGLLDDLLDRPAGQKAAALIGVVLAVVVLDWQYWYGGNQRQLADIHGQLATRRAELENKQKKTNARGDAEREIRDLAAELADLLSAVAASGRSAGMEITLFRQKAEVYHDFYAEVPVEMQMRGTYHDVATFLDRVKRLDRIVNVSDIQLKKPRIDGDRVWLEVSCMVNTFRFLDEAERARITEEKKKAGKKEAGKA